jgi:hypothetical protein
LLSPLCDSFAVTLRLAAAALAPILAVAFAHGHPLARLHGAQLVVPRLLGSNATISVFID